MYVLGLILLFVSSNKFSIHQIRGKYLTTAFIEVGDIGLIKIMVT